MKKFLLLTMLFFLVSCDSGASKIINKDNDDESINDSDVVTACTEGKTKCIDNTVFKCESEEWAEWEDCSVQGLVCAVKAGAAQCLTDGR
jgi:hypothetical protein